MLKIILCVLLLPVLIFISVIASYEDIKFGKIRNKWIILGISWGLFIFSAFFVWRLVATPVTKFFYLKILGWPPDAIMTVFTMDFSFLGKTFLNFIVAVIVSFLMWRFNAWAAGDAKLFIVASLLIPVFFYWKSFFVLFPSFVLLVNIFVIFLIYLFFNAANFLFSEIKSQIRGGEDSLVKAKAALSKFFIFLKEKARDKKLWMRSIQMVSIPLVVILFFSFLQQPLAHYLKTDAFVVQSFFFASLIIFYDELRILFKKKPVYVSLIVIFIGVCIFGLSTQGLSFLPFLYSAAKMTIIFMAFFILFQILINFYIKKTQIRKIKIEELEAGMLIDISSLAGLSEKKEARPGLRIGGLAQEQVDFIKQRAKEKGVSEVSICRACPFAVWIFVGIVFTLIFGQSLISVVFRFM